MKAKIICRRYVAHPFLILLEMKLVATARNMVIVLLHWKQPQIVWIVPNYAKWYTSMQIYQRQCLQWLHSLFKSQKSAILSTWCLVNTVYTHSIRQHTFTTPHQNQHLHLHGYRIRFQAFEQGTCLKAHLKSSRIKYPHWFSKQTAIGFVVGKISKWFWPIWLV